jgi:hypothetical protein
MFVSIGFAAGAHRLPADSDGAERQSVRPNPRFLRKHQEERAGQVRAPALARQSRGDARVPFDGGREHLLPGNEAAWPA